MTEAMGDKMSPDPERVAEALAWIDAQKGIGRLTAVEEHALIDAARAWLAGSSPDYEAGARAIAHVDNGSPYENLTKPLQRLYDEMAHAAVNAALHRELWETR